MKVTNRAKFSELPHKQNTKVSVLTMDKIAAIACAILIFVMGKFQLSDLFGVKRIVQFILFIPLIGYFIVSLPKISRKHFSPLIGVVLLMLFVNMYFHMNILWLFDYIFSLVGLFILLTLSRRNIIASVEWIVGIATFFACIAMLQFVILVLFPDLAVHTRLGLMVEGGWTSINPEEGVPLVRSVHPIAYLGLMTYDKINILGIEISRMRSFTSEPSLLVVYFLFPAVLGLFLNKLFWTKCSLLIIVFCILSFSGSVQVSLVFSAIYFFASFVFPNRFIFIVFPIIILVLILGTMLIFGLDIFIAFDSGLAGSDSTAFLAKGKSLTIRSNGLIESVNEALNSPFGSPYIRELPLSLFLSSMISAGWTGTIMLLVFFYRLINRLNESLKIMKNKNNLLLGAAILFGIICTIFIFNDYAMLNYAGIIFLMFTYRLLEAIIPNDFKQTNS
jgi:hypothetical protein